MVVFRSHPQTSENFESIFPEYRCYDEVRFICVRFFRLEAAMRHNILFFSVILEFMDLNPLVLKMIKIYSIIALSCHLWACCYWRVKLWSSSLTELEDFAVSKFVSFEVISNCSSDLSVLPLTLLVGFQSDSEIYMMSFYFILTVFTTVGFGTSKI
jgi:hypothetical protein